MGQFQKRINQRHAEKLAEQRWQKFEQVDLSKFKNVPSGCVACYRNNIASVQVYERTTAIGKVLLAGIRTHVESASRLMTWRMKQRIKNEVFGAERSALEAYPPESELIDAADMFWLWVLPEGEKLPFSLHGAKRVQIEKKPEAFVVQSGSDAASQAIAKALQDSPDDIASTLAGDPPNVFARAQEALHSSPVIEGAMIAIVPEGMSVSEKIVEQAANDEVKPKRTRMKKIAE